MVFWWKVIFLSGVVKAVRSKSRYLNNGRVESAVAMQESVEDEITVRIVYEGRAARVLLDDKKLEEIEDYYDKCFIEGAN